MDFGLRYVGVGGVELQRYTDSNWIGSIVDRKSASQCCFILGSSMFSWER